jgi:hypothetical protein
MADAGAQLMSQDWETQGRHMILRPPRWWLYLSLCILAAGVAGFGASALFGMWGRAIAWALWIPWGLSWFRTMAIVDCRGIRTRSLKWRSHEWPVLRIAAAKRLPMMRRVIVHTSAGHRVHLPGRVTLRDLQQFLPADAVVTTDRANR